MRFVSKLIERDIIMFYRSLHKTKLVASREKRDNTGAFAASFELKNGWKKHKVYKRVLFKDFELDVTFISKPDCLIEKYSDAECNKRWREFLIEKFGEEYTEALNDFLTK